MNQLFFLLFVILNCSGGKSSSSVSQSSTAITETPLPDQNEEGSSEKDNLALFKGAIYLISSKELPVCNTLTNGKLFFIESTKKFNFCNGTLYEEKDLTGPPGITGNTGPLGSIGNIGPTGAIGARGLAGYNGGKGVRGQKGLTGRIGPLGIIGETGLTGPTSTGANGYLSTTRYPTINECKYSGLITQYGIDDDENGTLEDIEVDKKVVQCFQSFSTYPISNLSLSGTGNDIISNPLIFDNALYYTANTNLYLLDLGPSNTGLTGVEFCLVYENVFFIKNVSELIANVSGQSFRTNGVSGFSANLKKPNAISYFDGWHYLGAGTAFLRYYGAANNWQAPGNLNTSGDDAITNVALVGIYVIIAGNNSSSEKKLWYYNTTSQAYNTLGHVDLNSIPNPMYFQSTSDYIYFVAQDTNARSSVWKTDGVTVTPVYLSPSGSTQAKELFKEGDFLLWSIGNVSDTSNLGIKALHVPTQTLGDLTNLTSSGILSEIHLKQLGSNLIIIANSIADGVDLYKVATDLSISSFNINSSGSSNPSSLFLYKSNLYFSASDGTNGQELWKTNGSTASMVYDINPSGSSSPSEFYEFFDHLYFAADDGVSGRELWKIHSTSSTPVLFDLYPGSSSSNPSQLINFRNTLYFSAAILESTYELHSLSLDNLSIVSDSLQP